jgi:hypothetical protein
MSNIISLLKLETVHLYLDKNKSIIYFDILKSTYSKDNFILVLEYFKNFWILAEEQHCKYYLIIKINSLGIYPLNFYKNLVKYLTDLNDIFKQYLHSCAFICNNSTAMIILKPLFSLYKFTRPYKICKNYEDAIVFFNKTENQIVS